MESGTFFVLLLSSAHAAALRALVATVKRVSDGDTITALTSEGTKLHIRLLGIDSPEVPHGKKPGQPFGEEARDYLDHLIGGKTVRVETYGADRWKKRILAVIFDEQVNVNLLMVAMGYAEVYRGTRCQVYCRELEDAEARARRDRVDMWVQGDRYVSPTAFRRRVALRGGFRIDPQNRFVSLQMSAAPIPSWGGWDGCGRVSSEEQGGQPDGNRCEMSQVRIDADAEGDV